MVPAAEETSEIDVQPLYRVARVSIHVTRSRSIILLAVLIFLDLALVAAHLAASLPAVKALAPGGRLLSLDLAASANLPWTWTLLKLAAGGALCALMILAHPADRRPAPFWRLGAVLLAALALAHAARLHELWAAGLAPALLGIEAPRLYLALSRLLPLEIVAVAGIVAFAGRSNAAVAGFGLAGLALIAAELAIPAALLGALSASFEPAALAGAWRGGLDALALSLLMAALVFAIRDRQAVSVRYVYRGA